MQRIKIGLLALALLLGGVGHTSADVIYDTTYAWDGSSVVSTWGSTQSGATPTDGQTFVAPANLNIALENFTFYLDGFGGGGTTFFTAAIYAWSGSLIAGNPVQGATGPALYTSSLMSITDNQSGNFQQVTINTGGILLTPNENYVALLTTTDPGSIAANTNSFGSWSFGGLPFQHVSGNGGGGFNFSNDPTSVTTPWDDGSDLGDLAWTANFAAVPEPSSLTLLGLGATVLLGTGWRRRKQAAKSVVS
jgi:hypothetical protein